MKNEVIYIDTNSHGTMHEQFNAAMFLVFFDAFKNVKYYAGKSSLNNTTKLIDSFTDATYEKRPIFVVGGKGKVFLLLRTIVSALQNIRFLLFSSKNQLLVYNFNNFFSLKAINSLNYFLNRKIIICCHSEMKFVIDDCLTKGYFYRLRSKILRDIFLNQNIKINKSINFIVLGDSIKNNLSKSMTKEKLEQIISIDHPYLFSDCSKKIKTDTLKIGVIGTMAQEKGAGLLIEIAHGLNLKQRNDIEISIIGRIICDINQFNNVGIKLPDNLGKDSIPRIEFNNMISELDYILYLYPSTSYKFSASGSLLDALNLERPALSFENDYFQYIFDKFGSFGFLVENIDQMVYHIEKLTSNKNVIHHFEFKKIKSLLIPTAIKDNLISQLSTREFYNFNNDGK